MSDENQRGLSMLRFGLIFLGVVAGVYVASFAVDTAATEEALQASGDILYGILPVLAAVVVMMAAVNYLLRPKQVAAHLGASSGVKGWLLAAIAGIISHGPIYVWYPLLQDLQERACGPASAPCSCTTGRSKSHCCPS